MKALAFVVLWALAACAPQKLPDPSAFEAPDLAAAEVANDVQPETKSDATQPDAAATAEVAEVIDAAAAPDVVDAVADPGSAVDGSDVLNIADVFDSGDSSDTAGEADASEDTDAVVFVPMSATPCADPQALPDNCTQCTAGFVAVATATGSVCAADFPLWGPRPDAPSPAWFADTGKGTVTDSHSGRTWAKESSPVAIAWEAANGYCAGLTAGGHSDWRLPTLAELLTLRDPTAPAPTIVTALASTPKDFVWSASPVATAGQLSYWTVLFNGGTTAFTVATAKCYARCVR